MQGWGYGSWGGGAFGVGNLIVGSTSLATSGKQVSFKSDMIVTAGYRSIFDAQYQVTLELGTNITSGTASLTFDSDDVIVLTGTPMLANVGVGSLTITKNAVEVISTPTIEVGSQTLTTTVFAPTITTSVIVTPGLGSIGSSTTFQPTLSIGNNLSVGSTSVAFTENTAFVNHGHNTTVGTQAVAISEHAPSVSTSVVLTLGVGSLATSTKQVSVSLGANIAVGYREILDAQYQVSVVIGNNIGCQIGQFPHETMSFDGHAPGLVIGNVVPLGTTTENQVATYDPIMLAGSFEPAGRTIAPLAESRALIAIVQSADGNDLVVKDVALEPTRSLVETPISSGGNDILKVA